MDPKLFEVSAEVQAALSSGKGVVALESTIITHGMAYPENLKTALMLEKICRDGGVVPATIAILNGKVHIGLTEAQLTELAQSKDSVKVSTRDIAYVMARKLHGSTTVAATSLLAARAGIKVFVTGGIGGVHREFNETMDVSNDLVELGRIPILVVCAGAKSILDLPRTLEYLETEGVPVLGWQTEEFPAFLTRTSGLKCFKVDGSQVVADMLSIQFDQLKMDRAILLSVPIPQQHEIPPEENEKVTSQAIAEAKEKGISGKEVTPFLLKRMAELSEKKTLASNIELIANNCRVGVEIANLYAAPKSE